MPSNIDIIITAVDNLSATTAKIEKSIESLTKKSEEAARKTKVVTEKVNLATKKMAKDNSKMLEQLNEQWGKLTINLRRIGAVVGSVYAIRSAMTGLTSMSADFKAFNESMAYTNTIARLTTEDLASLTDEVRALSVQMGKSAPEIGMALYDIQSSGFSGANAIEILTQSTEGAIAGFTDTATAAQGLMAVMNSYNRKTGADAIDIMDAMFMTVDKGVITFKELASNIGTVTTISSQIGISFDAVSSAMAVLTKRGLSASESAVALSGLMNSLIKPSKGAKDAIDGLNATTKGLNFQWDIATLQSEGLAGMMDKLAKASQGNFEVIGTLIPNIRGLRAAAVLAGGGYEELVEMMDLMEGKAGSTNKAMVEANKSINRQLEALISRIAASFEPIGQKIAELQVGLYENVATFLDWANRNVKEIKTVAIVLGDLAAAFVTVKVAMFALAQGRLLEAWLVKNGIALKVFGANAKATTIDLKVLKAAIASMSGASITVGIAVLGFAAAMGAINTFYGRIIEIQQAVATASENLLNSILTEREKYNNSIKQLDDELLKAEESNNSARLNSLRNYEMYLKERRALTLEENLQKSKGISSQSTFFDPDKKRRDEERKTELDDLISKYKKHLGLKDATGLTIPEFPGFPPIDELMGDDADSAAKKIADTIKKITGDISDYYGELGGLANDYTKILDDQDTKFSDMTRDYVRDLEDITEKIDDMALSHKRAVSDIEEDIKKEKESFNESMDDRKKKFQDTMDDMKLAHSDRVEDLQHDIDLEVGFGARADQEKLLDLRKRLARENRDYEDKSGESQSSYDEDTNNYIDSNAEKLADLELRLAREKEDYARQTAEIQQDLKRREEDWETSNQKILDDTNESLIKLTESYQKAFDGIYDDIMESGVPSLLASIPKLLETAIGASIKGVDIPRNFAAETEFVKNWQGTGGRLPTQEEINTGVYGTASGPNNTVSVNINNPIVTDQSLIDSLVAQAQKQLGVALKQSLKGAY